MPTRIEGELLRYNREVTRSGGDGLGADKVLQKLAPAPFGHGSLLPYLFASSIPFRFSQYTIIYSLFYQRYPLSSTHWLRRPGNVSGTSTETPKKENGTSLKTAAPHSNTPSPHSTCSKKVSTFLGPNPRSS